MSSIDIAAELQAVGGGLSAGLDPDTLLVTGNSLAAGLDRMLESLATVLTDPELRTLWNAELGGMRDRIKAMRHRLVAGLTAAGVDDMGFITTQVGMFSYSGLTKDQMVALREQHGVYGTDKGRICVAALNDGNVDYVCRAIAAVRRG
jgi:aspartate/tyrosine/aromatic aminotransferase